MWQGIKQIRPVATLGDIGFVIASFAYKQGCSVVK
jgi:methionyl aminopeptidase